MQFLNNQKDSEEIVIRRVMRRLERHFADLEARLPVVERQPKADLLSAVTLTPPLPEGAVRLRPPVPEHVTEQVALQVAEQGVEVILPISLDPHIPPPVPSKAPLPPVPDTSGAARASLSSASGGVESDGHQGDTVKLTAVNNQEALKMSPVASPLLPPKMPPKPPPRPASRKDVVAPDDASESTQIAEDSSALAGTSNSPSAPRPLKPLGPPGQRVPSAQGFDSAASQTFIPEGEGSEPLGGARERNDNPDLRGFGGGDSSDGSDSPMPASLLPMGVGQVVSQFGSNLSEAPASQLGFEAMKPPQKSQSILGMRPMFLGAVLLVTAIALACYYIWGGENFSR